ncbi:MAG: 2-hydroxyhepta-2,4-diene-1,7-dioate isomerase [Acidobacteria bacterium]|nr:2-hydroxyhepta-2,4-diene-1,7-dioate isomerase [Acidobacteriota bacterium]MBW4045773.1 2-hydroxyhepta-2,4-diene-1,7-dioate isomerase [Acidobacteriota bacterium]
MKLYRTRRGCYVEEAGSYFLIPDLSWDEIVQQESLEDFCRAVVKGSTACAAPAASDILAPIQSQEVWAAGVTYYRSRNARMEESKDAGGGDFYDRVYQAERPELFFKATGGSVVGSGEKVRIRSDARWSVPEPEMTLLINARGEIMGYTIGNDMSSRDIEGENPLYLPQAKVYDGSCALGPCVFLSREPLPRETRIEIAIERAGKTEFAGAVQLTELKRDPETLVSYLYRDKSFPQGCFLMTGTGIVPPDSFTLMSGDTIRITIEAVGTLTNQVA